MDKPTQEQLDAVNRYARQHGRYWKQALRLDWERAQYPSVDDRTNDSAHLQELRNYFGPSWLIRFRAL